MNEKLQQIAIKTKEIVRIANEAVAAAKAENKRLGIPEFFFKNGKIYYIMPDGTIEEKAKS